MELTAAETQVLVAVSVLHSREQQANRETVDDLGRYYFGMYRADWSGAFESLETKRLLEHGDGGYVIPQAARALAEQVRQANPQFKFFYDEFFTRAIASPAHARFCERVYGRNLCQHGMMDIQQLEFLLRVLSLDDDTRVLDLGCGNGMIAEYISDATGAYVTGMDTSAVGIGQAIERTRGKATRLAFICGDMRQSALPVHSFDVIVAIDSLGFIPEHERLLERLRETIAPGGRLAAFHSAWAGVDEPKDRLRADGTRVAQALAHGGLKYQAFDFTVQEVEHWKSKLQVAEELREEFQAEGNAFLFERRHLEATLHQQYVQSGNLSRYLYLVEF